MGVSKKGDNGRILRAWLSKNVLSPSWFAHFRGVTLCVKSFQTYPYGRFSKQCTSDMSRTLQTSTVSFSRVSYLFGCNVKCTRVLRIINMGVSQNVDNGRILRAWLSKNVLSPSLFPHFGGVTLGVHNFQTYPYFGIFKKNNIAFTSSSPSYCNAVWLLRYCNSPEKVSYSI